MKKYRFLTEGETVQAGDECFDEDFNGGTWRKISKVNGDEAITRMEELSNEFRREIQFTGRVAFLVNYSPLIRVIIDTTGLTDEQIDDKLAEAAKAKHCHEHQQYMNDFGDNIDWENTKEDEEVPAEDEPTEPIGEYRYLEAGETIQEGDEEQIWPGRWEVNTDDIGNILGPMAAQDKLLRRKISAEPRYRPFVEGDVIEEGDQYINIDDNYWPFSESSIGNKLNGEAIKVLAPRKLIK